MTKYYLRPTPNKHNKVNESFDDNELNKIIKSHGGLDPRSFNYDARSRANYDIKKAKPVKYLTQGQFVDLCTTFSLYKPIYEQILQCNDGGIIVLHDADINSVDYYYKVYGRNSNFEDSAKYPSAYKEDTMEERTAKRRLQRKGL